jgi:hypothetical protein
MITPKQAKGGNRIKRISTIGLPIQGCCESGWFKGEVRGFKRFKRFKRFKSS